MKKIYKIKTEIEKYVVSDNEIEATKMFYDMGNKIGWEKLVEENTYVEEIKIELPEPIPTQKDIETIVKKILSGEELTNEEVNLAKNIIKTLRG